MKKTLIKQIKGNFAKLYIVRDGQRDFEILDYAEIRLFEETKEIHIFGDTKCHIRSNRISVVLANPLEELPKIEDSFYLEVDLKRIDGIYERVFIHNLVPVDIEIGGVWEFEIDPKSLDWSRFI